LIGTLSPRRSFAKRWRAAWRYHFVWCPKRRRKVLAGRVERDLREVLAGKAKDLDREIRALEIMSDHVHLFLSCPPSLAPSDAMFWLKGYTSRALREKYLDLQAKVRAFSLLF
jgi:putative transposase